MADELDSTPLDLDFDKQDLIDGSTPVDGAATEVEIREITTLDREKSSIWAQLQIQEYADTLDQRKKWSSALLGLVSFIIIMDFVIVVLVGCNLLTYSSSLALPSFIGASILEIFGLSILVVKYLFPGPKQD